MNSKEGLVGDAGNLLFNLGFLILLDLKNQRRLPVGSLLWLVPS